jgi:acetaldehyde dehydrogenase (acetylating)
MTLGCGSWGGNVTSDNVSPIHLMDIKRVAFETKPVNKMAAKQMPAATPARQTISRDKVAELVDKFLSTKVVKEPAPPPPPIKEPEPPKPESPVRTVIHELRPQSLTENGFNPEPVDFVSENDVRDAVAKGKKIYITAKTIVTPSARDLGDEKDVFAKV